MPGDGSAPRDRGARPGWMTALAAFCLGTVLFLVPRDLFFAETRDVEVWFGFEVHGVVALLTAPLHWTVFLVGAWGFWTRRPWIVPTATAYVFYVAISHVIWNGTSPRSPSQRSRIGHMATIHRVHP